MQADLALDYVQKRINSHPTLQDILKRLPESRQTLLFSATLPKMLVDFAKAGLTDPTLSKGFESIFDFYYVLTIRGGINLNIFSYVCLLEGPTKIGRFLLIRLNNAGKSNAAYILTLIYGQNH